MRLDLKLPVCVFCLGAFTTLASSISEPSHDRFRQTQLQKAKQINSNSSTYAWNKYAGEKRSSSDEEDIDPPLPSSTDPESSSKTMRVPQINFYSSFPNAISVIGNSLLWFRELSAALGTPLPLWIFSIPCIIVGVGLIFLPDLTVLNLPFFYPSGDTDVDDDPLIAFPPVLDFEFDDVQRFKDLLKRILSPESSFF